MHRLGRTLKFASAQRLRPRAVETFKIPDLPSWPTQNSSLRVLTVLVPFKLLFFRMALSKEMGAFNIDAILASTADQIAQEVEVMKPFVSLERGLKSYEDRY